MHQRSITLDQFAEIFESLQVLSRTDTGFLLVTIGKHPALGSIVAIQDPAPELILLSELPLEAAMVCREPTWSAALDEGIAA